MSARTASTIAVLAATAALVLAACGDEDAGGSADAETPSEGADDALQQVTVGVQPFAELAPFYIAIEEGLFAEHGIEVEPFPASQGAELITAMVAGDVPIIYANHFSSLTAVDQGLDVQIFRENDRGESQALYVLPDSEFQEPEDFEGASIAVSGLGNVMEMTARAVLEHHGVDLSTVEFVELPPPNMQAALEQGQVDAAWLVEPFISFASQAGAVPAVSAFEGPTENAPVAGWATTSAYFGESPEVVAGFAAAIDEAMQIVAEDPEAVADIIPTYTEMSAEVAASLSPIGYAIESDLSDLSVVEELLLQYDVIGGSVDLGSLVLDPTTGGE
ncbi:ABC transporter substrate-binding protein [Georgenia sp. Z1491]|uniref:ABC transporter substrate-binding protein n=1 Tax=Georgenia sp. Z1491 TaxID=3416707 RepID=UPI003CE7B249